ncbi:MAG: MerR family transcriptional regulator [Bacteroides sp.]|jgi:DNA-binding transcriptional MerR regulator|nr:MerR family transcriptional regulator [Bacteroides sp.]
MIRYSINDLEKITGIKAHTIRIWEKRYDVVSPKRTPTNIRYYNDEDLLRLLNISTLNKHGFKISDIVSMSSSDICEKIRDISRTSTDFESQINNLIVAMIELNEESFEKVLSSTILKIGFEKTVTHVLYPLLEKIGVLWQIGTINPAQEHFLTNLIRQKMIVAIDGQNEPLAQDAKTFLLFLPEKEWHELGLLFYTYLIKKNGHKVIYLGQNVPFKDVTEVVKIRKADYLLTYFVAAMPQKDIPYYIQDLSKALPDKNIFITGHQVHEIDFKLPKNIIILNNTEDFKRLV